MAPASTVDKAILTAATIEHVSKKTAQTERAKAIDAVVELLFERAELRHLLREALPYLDVAPTPPLGVERRRMLPRIIAWRARRLLEE